MTRPFSRAALTALVLPMLVACPGPPPDPALATIATVGGTPVRLGEFESYLRSSFPDASAVEAPSLEEADRVKSRLLDDFLDERLLLAEAESRGISASDKDLEAYLGGPDAAPDAVEPSPERRENARREIVIQKLRESVVRAEAPPSDEDVRRYLQDHREALGDSLARARDEILLRRSHEATDRLLEDLRRRTPIEIRAEALPFRYIAAGPEGAP